MNPQHDGGPRYGPALEPDIAPLERLVAPAGLTGEQGTRRLAKVECRISAQCDRDAIVAWLADVAGSDDTYRAYRGAAEKLLNWACFERHVALSSLEPDDLLAFISFLNEPRPACRWTCPRGTRRASDHWRPFNGSLGAASQLMVMQILASLFHWLSTQQYALLPPISDLRSTSSGFGDQSIRATQRRRCTRAPLSQSAWRWVERRLADETDPPTLETRLVVELLYFAGMQLVEVQGLVESHCVAPTRRFPAWRLYLPTLPVSHPCVYALPPLARTLDEWFGPRAAMLRPGAMRSASDVWSDVPVFYNCARAFAQVSRLFRQASAMAATHEDRVASCELAVATPMALRRAIELHGANDQAFTQGFIVHSRFKHSPVLRYYERVAVTPRLILGVWQRLRHLWSTYPLYGDNTRPVSRVRRSGLSGFTAVSDLMLRSKCGDPRIDPAWSLTTFTTGAAIDVYRSVDRYIRTHVAPRRKATLAGWTERPDPSKISTSIRNSPDERAAWTYRLWASAVEPAIQRRRWSANGIPPWNARRVQLTIPAPKSFLPCVQSSGPTDQVVLNHTGDTLMAAWHFASRVSRASVANGQVSWGPGAIRVQVDQQGRSFNDTEVSPLDRLAALPQHSKAERSFVRARENRDRRDRLARACRGDCLTYRSNAGWSFVEDLSGDSHPAFRGDARRVRLLGVEGHPAVVLYKVSGQYAARLIELPLQAVACTPKECFAGLRDACRQYKSRYGAKWLGGGCPSAFTRVIPTDTDALGRCREESMNAGLGHAKVQAAIEDERLGSNAADLRADST